MKTSRFLAVPALAAASLLALTGCIQLPPVGGGTSPTTGGDSGTESGDLAGTSWTGAIDDGFDIGFTLNEDGTVDITTWGTSDESYDEPEDVWSGDASDLTVTITGITGLEEGPVSLTFAGTALDGEMELNGEAPDGSSHSLVASQD